MQQFRQNFENELRIKLQQKSKNPQNEEALLIKTFKFFDLDNSGGISKEEFLKAVEKIGIQIFDPQDFYDLFEIYDQDRSGEIDYKEFVGAFFNNQGGRFRKNSPENKKSYQQPKINKGGFLGYKKEEESKTQPNNLQQKQAPYTQNYMEPQDNYPQSPNKSIQQKQKKKKNKGMYSSQAEFLLDKIRNVLSKRGAKGFLGLQRQFRIMDDDHDFKISYDEFHKAMHDYRIGLSEEETQLVYHEMDLDNDGTVSIDELIRAVIGVMNEFRKQIVLEAFKKMDKDGSGDLTLNDIKGVYNAKFHPDVKSGKKTEDDILNEFLETFEMHHSLRSGSRDHIITKQEFLEYYNNISANIDNNEYFKTMMVNGYKLYETNPIYQDFAPFNRRGQYPQQKRQTPFGTDTDVKKAGSQQQKSQAPFGTDDKPTEYQTTNKPQTGQADIPQNATGEQLIEILRQKIKARGTRGVLQMGKLFRIIDDNNDRTLQPAEFKKVCKDLRLNFKDDQVSTLFQFFDKDHNGTIDYDEFLLHLRGQMNNFRKNLVKQAFNKLDKDKSGVIDVDDLHGVFNAKNHPDVRSGKKTEDEVMVDWLDTFELHHALETGDQQGRDHIVTLQEFMNYYDSVSCSIDDDAYFEAMIRKAWNLDNIGPYKKAKKLEY